jgi:hypothetical protein
MLNEYIKEVEQILQQANCCLSIDKLNELMMQIEIHISDIPSPTLKIQERTRFKQLEKKIIEIKCQSLIEKKNMYLTRTHYQKIQEMTLQKENTSLKNNQTTVPQ